ncbi:hypothetical protein [Prevotella pallens]|uniref:Uncharacterized protein n=1 Tax=Prevotella pallens TaxID=60133 RepID=A0A379GA11_9BACT|nr:hypothetical protein [Prevotella pallens]SUC37736.1 Uncharacterised protein [Prevotella pallens]
MEICILGLRKYTVLVTQGYGHDESAPTPDGMFATNFVGVRNVIAIRLQHFGKPFAAVGADLSRPHIRKHPRNGKRICACNKMNAHI